MIAFIPNTVVLDTLYGSLLESSTKTIGSMMPMVSDLAALLGAVFCGWSLLQVYREYMNSHTVDGWNIVRPVLLLMCVMFFTQIIHTPVQRVTGWVSRDLAKVTSAGGNNWIGDFITKCGTNSTVNIANKAGWVSSDSRSRSASGTSSLSGTDDAKPKSGAVYRLQNGLNNYKRNILSGVSDDGNIWQKVKAWVGAYFKGWLGALGIVGTWASMGLVGILASILAWIMEIVIIMQQILAYTYVTILAALGPLVFAFAIIPTFSNGIGAWFARYVHFSLWVPMSFIVQSVCKGISMAYVNGGGSGIMAIAILFANITALAAVPAFCKFVLETSGADEAMRSMGGVAQKAAGVGKAAAGLVI